MIGTNENRAVLHVESSSGAANEKYHPAWSVESIVPILWLLELRNIWVYAFWTEPSVHLMNRPWEMPSPSIQIPLTTLRWKTMRNF